MRLPRDLSGEDLAACCVVATAIDSSGRVEVTWRWLVQLGQYPRRRVWSSYP